MDPLSAESLGDLEEEHVEDFDCSADIGGSTSSEHNSMKSSTRECSPYASATEIVDTTYVRDERLLSDNGDVLIHGSAKAVRLPRVSGFRLSEGHKKSVQMQFDGRKFKSTARSYVKKDKQPDISAELTRCKDEDSNYLEFSDFGLQCLPTGIFKDLSHVETLFLNGNKLTGLPPGQLTWLPNLRRLLLQQNAIVCAGLPPDLAKLSSLEVLDLRHNRLEGQLPPCIYALIGLKQLILSYNKILSLDNDIKNLQRLTILIVNRNSIRQSIPNTIGQLSFLTKLDLSYNHIQTLPASLGQCTQLTELYLHYNQLTNLPETIGNLIKLNRLMLKYNRLVEIPESLAKCTRLDEFNVENNQLSTLPALLLANMSSVRNVTFSRNFFSVFPPGDCEQYVHVMSLNMDHNKVTEVPVDVLLHLSKVTKLNLRDNEIAGLHADDLRHWSNLVELDLGSNHLSCLPDELEALLSLEMFRLSYNQLKRLPNTLGKLQRLRVLDLESNQLESLPPSLGDLVNLQDLNVSCNRLTTFPPSIGNLRELKTLKAGENDIIELPPEIGNMSRLRDFYLNDNRNLNNLPAEMSQCTVLTILSVENCPLRDLPQPIVSGGSAMIIYFLQQVLQLRRQHTAL